MSVSFPSKVEGGLLSLCRLSFFFSFSCSPLPPLPLFSVAKKTVEVK